MNGQMMWDSGRGGTAKRPLNCHATTAVAVIALFMLLSGNGWTQTARTVSYSCKCLGGVNQTARLQLNLQGRSVSGSMHMAAACGSNMRDYGVSLDAITATLSGKWEAQGSAISGSYKGKLIACDGSSTPRAGTIGMTLASGGEIAVKLTGHYYNNYTCKPTGIVYDPNAPSQKGFSAGPDRDQPSGKADPKVTTTAQAGYNPLTDPNREAPGRTGDPSKAGKYTDDFQKGQWTPLDSKERKIKEQPIGQPQPPEYLGFPPTTVFTTVPPGWTTIPTTPPPATTTGATSGNLIDVTVDRRDVTITVWDHGTAEDGDIITLYLNGRILKSHLRLTRKKQSFRVNLAGGQNRFEVEAVNEGSKPPNTATVEISNVTRGKPIQIYERKTGQRASMHLIAP